MFAHDYYDIGVNLLVLLLLLPPLLLPPSVPKRHPIDAPNHSACPASLSFQFQNSMCSKITKLYMIHFELYQIRFVRIISLHLVSFFNNVLEQALAAVLLDEIDICVRWMCILHCCLRCRILWRRRQWWICGGSLVARRLGCLRIACTKGAQLVSKHVSTCTKENKFYNIVKLNFQHWKWKHSK